VPATGRATARSWLIWLAAVTVYLLAVFHRTSFGVAGLQAAERFGVGAAALGTFTVLQVGVYAAMQIPTGVLVDRYGPRRVLTVAVLVLGAGQLLLGVAHSYGLGLLARGVLGLGDALTFVSVLRLVAAHFPGRQYALLTSFTAAVGYIGNLAATVPLSLVLDGAGWTSTFLAAGAITVLYTVVVALRVRDVPAGEQPPVREQVRPRDLAHRVAEAWRTPGTRLGFWVHFSTMFAPNALTLLWGVPWLVQGQGQSKATASALLTVFVFGSMAGGPLLGGLIGRRPSLRMPLVGGYIGGAALIWAVLLSWPGQVPVGLLVPAFAFLALGGPASMIGFALARDYNPLSPSARRPAWSTSAASWRRPSRPCSSASCCSGPAGASGSRCWRSSRSWRWARPGCSCGGVGRVPTCSGPKPAARSCRCASPAAAGTRPCPKPRSSPPETSLSLGKMRPGPPRTHLS